MSKIDALLFILIDLEEMAAQHRLAVIPLPRHFSEFQGNFGNVERLRQCHREHACQWIRSPAGFGAAIIELILILD